MLSDNGVVSGREAETKKQPCGDAVFVRDPSEVRRKLALLRVIGREDVAIVTGTLNASAVYISNNAFSDKSLTLR